MMTTQHGRDHVCRRIQLGLAHSTTRVNARMVERR
jgi:hypothetical protein